MIKTRLIKLLSHAKKYIVYNVLLQWIGLISQIFAIFTIGDLLSRAACEAGLDTKSKPAALTSDCILRAVIILACVLVIRLVCERLESRVSFLASVDVKRILRQNIYEKILRLGPSYQEQVPTSEVVQVSTEGVEQLETYFGKYLSQFFYSMLAPITLFIVLMFVDVKSSVVLLVVVPLIPLSIVVVQKIAKRLLNKYWSVYTELGDSFLENLQGLTTLKIYKADQMKAVEMDKESEHFRKITMKVLTMQLNSTSVMDIVAYGGAAVGMVVATTGFAAGRLDFAGTLTIVLLASEFFLPLRLLGSYFHIAMNGMAASDKIFGILDLPEPEEGDRRLSKEPSQIDIENLHFSYEEDREIIKGITIHIPAKGLVALVGESGCGKSTVAGILMGRNKGYSGTIAFGDAELSEVKATSLMEYATLLNHDSYIFKGSVRDNLLMAKPKASDQECIEALQKANLWDFLSSQQGLDTMLAERASNISGGQRQRLALSRALLSPASLFIFDEATSNIDMESEEMIMEVIRKLSKEKTVIFISHRLANVTEADCIYMFDQGQIVEEGRHQALMEKNGVYAKLFTAQQELETYGMERKEA